MPNNPKLPQMPPTPPQQNPQGPRIRIPDWLIWLLLIVGILWFGFRLPSLLPFSSANNVPIAIPYSFFKSEIASGAVRDVNMAGTDVSGDFNAPVTWPPAGSPEAQGQTPATSTSFMTVLPPVQDNDLMPLLAQHNVIVVATDTNPNTFLLLLFNYGPFLLIGGLILWSVLRMRRQQQGIFGFAQSQARRYNEERPSVTFGDVAGEDAAKRELAEVVDFLKDSEKYTRLGARIPRGVLLVGPPGTGKTLLARAVAGEAKVPFFSLSASEFVEMFVGVGASRVRDLFTRAKAAAPCIVFIDELDAVGRRRGAGLGGGNDEREQTLNQLLVEMDGFEANEGVILIAATNRPDVLDPALLRPGRFDRQVVVPNPDVVGREQILKVHVRKVPLAPDINLKTIARGTPGFSGADLMNLVNEAALTAARRNKRMVTQAEFEEAKDKVMMGAERKSLVMTEEEKMLTAYHEGGHAIVGLNVVATDPIYKATIIPRGRALGMVMQLPERDKLSMSLEQMTSRLAIMMGGRVAEELIFGREKVTSGAASDIEQATRLARMMVTRWGLSEELGTVSYGENQDEVFLGMSVSRTQNASEATVQKIDSEIRRLVEEGYNQATKILTEKRADLEALAKGLLEYETLTGDEITDLLKGKKPNRESVLEPTTPRASAVPPAGKPRPRPDPDTGMEPQPQA